MGPRNMLILFFSTLCVSLVLLIILFSFGFKDIDLEFNTKMPESAPDLTGVYKDAGQPAASKADTLTHATIRVPTSNRTLNGDSMNGISPTSDTAPPDNDNTQNALNAQNQNENPAADQNQDAQAPAPPTPPVPGVATDKNPLPQTAMKVKTDKTTTTTLKTASTDKTQAQTQTKTQTKTQTTTASNGSPELKPLVAPSAMAHRTTATSTTTASKTETTKTDKLTPLVDPGKASGSSYQVYLDGFATRDAAQAVAD